MTDRHVTSQAQEPSADTLNQVVQLLVRNSELSDFNGLFEIYFIQVIFFDIIEEPK